MVSRVRTRRNATVVARQSRLRVKDLVTLEGGRTKVIVDNMFGWIVEVSDGASGSEWLSAERAKLFRRTNGQTTGIPPEVTLIRNGRESLSPFGLQLFWRHYGADHLGCVLVPFEIEITDYIAAVSPDRTTMTQTWCINGLSDIQWARLLVEQPNQAGFDPSAWPYSLYFEAANAWREYQEYGATTPPKSVYIVANTGLHARTFNLKVDLADLYHGYMVRAESLRLDPEDEGTWEAEWQPETPLSPGVHAIPFNKFPSHHVILLRFSPIPTATR
jgi:hypothetical protein